MPWWVVAFALCGVLGSVALYRTIDDHHAEDRRMGLARYADVHMAFLQSELKLHQEVVRSGRRLFTLSDVVTADEFRRFVDEARDTHPDLRSVAWVPAADVAGVPAVMVEPPEAAPFSDIGALTADPAVARLLATARDSGAAVVLPLAGEGKDAQSPRLLNALPVYDIGRPAATVQDRRVALRGYVVSATDLTALIDSRMGDLRDHGMEASVSDVTVPGRPLLLYTLRGSAFGRVGEHAIPAPDCAIEHVIPVYGRRWSICIRTAVRADGSADEGQAAIVLALGLFATVAGVGYLRAVQSREDRIGRVVAQRTAELAASESRLRVILDTQSDCVKVIDAHGRVRSSNLAGLGLCEVGSEAEIIGTEALAYVAPEDREHVARMQREVLGGEVRECEFTVVGVAGGRRAVRGRLVPLAIAGQPPCVLAVTRDVTGERATAVALRRSEAQFRAILEGSVDPIAAIDVDHRYLFANEAAAQWLGLPLSAMIGARVEDVLRRSPDLAGRALAHTDAVLASGRSAHVIDAGALGDRHVEVEYSLGPLFDDAGRPYAVAFVLRDVTERNAAERAVAESESRLRHIVTALPAAVFVKDPDSRFLMVNPAAERLFGIAAERLLGTDGAHVWLPAQMKAFLEDDRRAFETGQVINVLEEEVFNPTLRESRICATIKTPVFDVDGSPRYIVATITDITERKRADAALQAALRRFEAVVEDTPNIAIQGYSRDGRIRYWNRGSELLYGYPADEAIGRPLSALLSEPGASRTFEQTLAAVWEDRKATPPGESPIRTRNGRDLWIQSSLTPVVENGEVVEVFCIDIDVTRGRQQELALRNGRAAMQALLDNFPFRVWLKDLDGRVVVANTLYAQSAGLSRVEDVIGRTVFDLFPPAEAAEYARADREVVASRSRNLREHRTLEAGEDRWWEAFRAPVIDGSGMVTGIVAYARDITDTRRADAERDRLQVQLQRVQRMETIGHLTGGIAHDFNNILASILGYASLALDRHVPDKEGKLAGYLREVITAGERARELIAKMLSFSRRDPGTPRPNLPSDLVDEVVGMVRSTLPSSIALEVDAAATPPIMVDPVHLHQVLTNLLVNARDAIAGSGHIRIGTATVFEEAETCAACHAAVEGHYVEIRVTDDGSGMPLEIVPRIFDPFFTTKDVGKGTGMGLAMVHGLVHDHAGHVLVQTAPGQGTTIRLLFPPLATEVVPSAAPEAPRPGGGAGMTVLVVDDERSVGRFLGELLEGHGYRVVVLTDPLLAVARFEDAPGEFDAVITDQTMPGLSGGELTARLLARRPDLPIILCTGYSDSMDARRAAEIGAAAFLPKPVPAGDLLAALSRVLGNPSA